MTPSRFMSPVKSTAITHRRRPNQFKDNLLQKIDVSIWPSLYVCERNLVSSNYSSASRRENMTYSVFISIAPYAIIVSFRFALENGLTWFSSQKPFVLSSRVLFRLRLEKLGLVCAYILSFWFCPGFCHNLVHM